MLPFRQGSSPLLGATLDLQASDVPTVRVLDIMQLCATLDPITCDRPTEPLEQGNYTARLCATLDRWAVFVG